ncbi:MAG: hypothetical protein Q4D33_13485, partial [Prevotellaceae bacterium]|nr:hypothetical protein [Prevotellaceae bacterium]
MARLRLFSASLIIVVSLCACNDNDDNTANDNIEDIEPSPKEDALTVNVSSKTFIFQGDYASTSAALSRRLTNIADRIDETVESVVINDNCIPSLTDQDYRDIMSVILRGGSIVYCSPTQDNADKLFRNLQRVGSQYEQNSIIESTEEGIAAF